ncbi:hypothetical protein K470DRAFT_6126 [Piedraia hortae CBS 480.64]|uniref:Uncharacterized protein n=1 Tax=Piedraia hortae CBS 480.64 TaxID=1314780 RepID=A0A6A7CAG5_9PEZI|nr:hypothetical protein K470DRAFT_6126 [Piedraia hortae CBS 480.64]
MMEKGGSCLTSRLILTRCLVSEAGKYFNRYKAILADSFHSNHQDDITCAAGVGDTLPRNRSKHRDGPKVHCAKFKFRGEKTQHQPHFPLSTGAATTGTSDIIFFPWLHRSLDRYPYQENSVSCRIFPIDSIVVKSVLLLAAVHIWDFQANIFTCRAQFSLLTSFTAEFDGRLSSCCVACNLARR